jgi:alpha-1,2-glucosyltransferase
MSQTFIWTIRISYPTHSYLLSLLLKRLFLVKCNVAMLRLTPALTLLALPIALTRLLCYHKRERPPPFILSPLPEAIILSAFPIVWFFGFLYYTEVPSVLFVVLTVVASTQHNHWLAALVCSTNHYEDFSNLTIDSWVS